MRQTSLAAIGFLILATPCRAVEQADIQRAIDRGVIALKRLQREDGTWPHPEIGATALAGLTLLECGVPANDPAIQKAAQKVRLASTRLTHTYSLSLSVLFLDRLDVLSDTPLIESMIVRLLAGQSASGGWQYTCPEVAENEVRRLSAYAAGGAELRATRDLSRLPAKGKRTVRDLSKEIQAQIVALGNRSGAPIPTDNSNTQFATLALWVGRRYGVPVDNALLKVEKRFRSSQLADGGWTYLDTGGGPGSAISTATMTCAGLLGLAVGHGVHAGVARSRKPDAGLRDVSKDRNLKAGLQALASAVGTPVNKGRNRAPQPVAGASGKAFYFLWSLERVCVALKLETLGKKDWYAWGSEVLLANQQADGTWQGEYGAYGADTCFALLFLKKANLARDLTASIKGLSDPGSKILKAGGVGGAGLEGAAVPALGGVDIGGNPQAPTAPRVEAPTKPVEKAPEKPLEKNPDRPLVREKPTEMPPRETVDPAGLGKELLQADSSRRGSILEQLREGKGVAYTEALATAIPNLENEAKRQAREALAERVARMTTTSVRNYLRDPDAEIRRAAALACAMKESKPLIPDLIRLLADPDPTVERAVVAALKDLTGQNFGPRSGADKDERARAIAAWELWWSQQGR